MDEELALELTALLKKYRDRYTSLKKYGSRYDKGRADGAKRAWLDLKKLLESYRVVSG